MKESVALVLTFLVVVEGQILRQGFDPLLEQSCCAAYLMDSDGRAVLDLGSPLVAEEETFRALKVKICTGDAVYIQLWSPTLDKNVWKLEFQQLIPGHNNQRLDVDTWKMVNITGGKFKITPQMRLGVQAPDGQGLGRDGKIPVQYKFNSSFISLRSNKIATMDKPFRVGDLLTYDTLHWPRQFAIFVIWCEDTTCRKYQGYPFVPISISGPPGPPGRPGAPGTPGKALDPTFQLNLIGCYGDDPGFTRKLANIKNKTNTMENLIQKVDRTILQLTKSKSATGSCGNDGFIHGDLGVGSCYKFVAVPQLSLGEAAMYCSDYKATLLSIENGLEYSFVIDQMELNKGNKDNGYYTTAMFNNKIGSWVWYTETADGGTDIYSIRANLFEWAPGHPKPYKGRQQCMYIRLVNKKMLWYSTMCNEKHSFICKRPKECH